MGVSAEWAARREEELRNSPHWASIQAGRNKRKAHALESIKRFGNEYWKHPEYKKENPRKRLHPARAVPPAGGNTQPGHPGPPGFGGLMPKNPGPKETYGDTTRPTFEYPEGPPRRADGTLHPQQAEVDKNWWAMINKHKQAQEEQHQSNVTQFGEGYMDNEEWWKTQDTPFGRHGQYSAIRKSGRSHEDAIHMLQGGGPVNPPPPREVDPSKWNSPWTRQPPRPPWMGSPTQTPVPRPPTPAGTSGPRVITPLPGAIGNTPAAPSFAADLYNEGIMRRNQQNRPLSQRYRPLTQKSNSYNNYIGQIRNNLRPLGYQPINR